ncbi:cyclin-like protein [Radiomyces spectabilis]|uniref:cyclin-like protein n=1 Tax=Radiomyces spectabilis TaxID=64574 RepID=UPI00221E690E|nr:cyclin-like protein [Radiomyces spectabilis]KAI8381579.1 cyclin-like protein [Radiomyces spectabilis]
MSADQWYFSRDELFDTPSIADGVSFAQEQMDRIKGCHYLLAVGAKLNLPQLVVVTAATFFHRFFMRQSMKRFHVYDIAATSLFVATKVEECTRRIKDFVNACAQKAQKNDKLYLEEGSKDFVKWKDTMLHNEVILLETLCFDLSIEHPHINLLDYQNQLSVSSSSIRKAWMLLYQSLGQPICVLYRPNVIAAAALLLAAHLSSEQMKDNWWKVADVDIGQVHELAAEMLEYYVDRYIKKSSQSPHP